MEKYMAAQAHDIAVFLALLDVILDHLGVEAVADTERQEGSGS